MDAAVVIVVILLLCIAIGVAVAYYFLVVRKQKNTTSDVDCVVRYNEWGECKLNNGKCQRTRTNTILVQPQGNGRKCPDLVETQDCSVDECKTPPPPVPDVDCVYTSFSDWSTCSAPCGPNGTQTRSRSIQTPSQGNGKPCDPSSLIQTQSCNTSIDCDEDCAMSQWSESSPCSASCNGGVSTKTRTILKPSKGRGAPCGALEMSVPCNEQPCDSDCQYSAYSSASQCSAVCGPGYSVKTCSIIKPASGNGKPCDLDSLTVVESCNLGDCRTSCEVSPWSDWSSCSRSCSGGVKTRTRTVTKQPTPGGLPCPSLQESVPCNLHPCPQDCVLGDDYSAWGECSVSCGGTGVQTRYRRIAQYPNDLGKPCDLSQVIETRSCEMPACTETDAILSPWSEFSECDCTTQTQTRTRTVVKPGTDSTKTHILKETRQCLSLSNCKVDCQVSDFSDPSECNSSCKVSDVDPQQHRSRSIIQFPQNGGAPCPDLVVYNSCDTLPCPISCQVSEFGEWSSCDKDCGGGIRTRSRTITQQPANGGQGCPPLTEQEQCNTQPCPSACVLSDWSDYSECTAPCKKTDSDPNPQQHRTRSVVQEPVGTGTPCGNLIEYRDCNTNLCPINCEVGQFSDFTPCTKNCGTGTQTRTRSITVQPANGGEPCPNLTETQECNSQPCAVDCVLSSFGDWSTCSASCHSEGQPAPTQTRTRTIVTQPAYGGKSCDSLQETRECNVDTYCPIDCIVNDINNSQWSTCSNCAQTRTQQVVQQPKYGGKECPTLETQTQCCDNCKGCTSVDQCIKQFGYEDNPWNIYPVQNIMTIKCQSCTGKCDFSYDRTAQGYICDVNSNSCTRYG